MLPTEEKKKRAFIFLAIAMGILFILSIGISGLTFKEATALNLLPTLQNDGLGQTPPVSNSLLQFFRIFLAVVLIGFPFFLIYMLINPKRRKELIRLLVMYAILLSLFYYLSNIPKQTTKTPDITGTQNLPSQTQQALPTPPDTNKIAPTWLVNTVAIAVGSVGLMVIGFGVYWFLLRIRKPEVSSIRRVASEAEDAIAAIQAGGDLKSTIIQCYRQMIAAVRAERGIQRPYDATPHEFEQILLEKGLPAGPVRDLTRLFEQARYGQFEGSFRYQLEAVSCLEEIVKACRATPISNPVSKGKTA